MKQIQIPGFSQQIKLTDKPTVSVYGDEGSGKTRFAATAPDPIGLLPIDDKSKRTFKPVAEKMGKIVFTPDANYINHAEAQKMAMLDSEKKENLPIIKQFYTELHKRVLEDAMKLASNRDIASVVVDSNTVFWHWILFGHFGRRNKIDQFSRDAPNNDMQEFIGALKHKNLILLHRSAEIYKNTGEVDAAGRPKGVGTGKFKSEGCTKLGYLINIEVELVSAPKADDLDKKFRMRIRECQNNPLIEGEFMDEYGLKGEGITWDNIMTVIGWED